MEANTNGNQGLKKEGYYNLKTCCCPLPNTVKAENGIADLVDKSMTAKKGRPGKCSPMQQGNTLQEREMLHQISSTTKDRKVFQLNKKTEYLFVIDNSTICGNCFTKYSCIADVYFRLNHQANNYFCNPFLLGETPVC